MSAAESMTWRPIETAPKDGTTILVRSGPWLPYRARWDDEGWQPIEFDGSYFPTLWLPEPPTEAA